MERSEIRGSNQKIPGLRGADLGRLAPRERESTSLRGALATKQSIIFRARLHGLLRFARNDG
jgi:hypothetical protein